MLSTAELLAEKEMDMGLARLFTRYVLGVRTEELPWARDAWKAVQEGGDLRIVENDVTEKFGLDPKRDVARQLRNEQISIFYLKSRVGHERRETLDILVMAQKRGGMVVRFTNGSPVRWNRPSARRQYDVPNRERYWYAKLLEEARKTV